MQTMAIRISREENLLKLHPIRFCKEKIIRETNKSVENIFDNVPISLSQYISTKISANSI